MTTPHRVERLGEIDLPWMESVLATSGLPVRIRSVSCKPVGDGKISQVGRVQVEYYDAPANAPRSFICKLHSAHLDAHRFAVRIGLYRGESHAYKVVYEEAACNVPRPYWVAGDTDWINLLLEDLGPSTDPGNQIKGCGVDDARAMVSELARLHSHFFSLDADGAPSWLTRLDEAGRSWSAMIVQGAETLLSLFSDTLSVEHQRVLQGVPEAVQRFYAYPFRHLTFSHGETRVDNVLFDRSGPTPNAIIIDWQNVGLRSPMFDVCYFLSGSVSVEDRRLHESGLLEEYAQQFESKASGYGRKDIEKDYRLNLLSGLFQTAAGAAFLCPDPKADTPEAVTTFLSALMNRNLHAVSDWDSLCALQA